jgi:hypothetical protein
MDGCATAAKIAGCFRLHAHGDLDDVLRFGPRDDRAVLARLDICAVIGLDDRIPVPLQVRRRLDLLHVRVEGSGRPAEAFERWPDRLRHFRIARRQGDVDEDTA